MAILQDLAEDENGELAASVSDDSDTMPTSPIKSIPKFIDDIETASLSQKSSLSGNIEDGDVSVVKTERNKRRKIIPVLSTRQQSLSTMTRKWTTFSFTNMHPQLLLFPKYDFENHFATVSTAAYNCGDIGEYANFCDEFFHESCAYRVYTASDPKVVINQNKTEVINSYHDLFKLYPDGVFKFRKVKIDREEKYIFIRIKYKYSGTSTIKDACDARVQGHEFDEVADLFDQSKLEEDAVDNIRETEEILREKNALVAFRANCYVSFCVDRDLNKVILSEVRTKLISFKDADVSP